MGSSRAMGDAILHVSNCRMWSQLASLWLRPRMWPLLVDLDQRAQDLVVRYPILLQSMDCEYEEKIMKDLARTFPMHPLFAERGGVGQQKMFNVLKAYAVHDPTLGYCQVR